MSSIYLRNMEKPQVRFEAYGGSKIYPIGKFKAMCEKNNVKAEQEFNVCRSNVALLGLQSVLKFNIVQVGENTGKPVLLIQEPQISGDLEQEKSQFRKELDFEIEIRGGRGVNRKGTSLKRERTFGV
uniref:Uncharacterized protein n=1 Tax=Cacopsylla melanoneura TaxID=428564 RepID=A0A8D8WG79_9HEMI